VVLPLFKEAGVGYCKVMQRAVIRVEGMDCEDCARAIARLLEQTPGVSTAEISLDRSQAVVELAPPADTTRIVMALQKEGYGARVLR
jgi:copper chaperone